MLILIYYQNIALYFFKLFHRKIIDFIYKYVKLFLGVLKNYFGKNKLKGDKNMKTKKINKKLVLNKKTIASLNHSFLKKALGGADCTYYDSGCQHEVSEWETFCDTCQKACKKDPE